MAINGAASMRTGHLSGWLCAATAAIALSGCGGLGGGNYSGAPHTWASEAHSPKVLTLQDTRTGEDVWTVEIPVGSWLTTRFLEGGGADPELYPDRLAWRLREAGKSQGGTEHVASVPPADSRKWVLTLRESPEIPEDLRSGG